MQQQGIKELAVYRLEHHVGITGKCLAWMQPYLTDRYQTLCIDGELSQPVHMKYSIPQRSVLCPKILHHVHKTSWNYMQKAWIEQSFLCR